MNWKTHTISFLIMGISCRKEAPTPRKSSSPPAKSPEVVINHPEASENTTEKARDTENVKPNSEEQTTPQKSPTQSPKDIKWVNFGAGISQKKVTLSSEQITIVMGGYSATLGHVEAWADELQTKHFKSKNREIYATSGPNQAQYLNKEIQNSKLSQHISDSSLKKVIIMAHSSGSFVAQELLLQLASKENLTTKEIFFFNLDGAGFTKPSQLNIHTIAVYAEDKLTGTSSSNKSSMLNEHITGSKGKIYKSRVESRCNSGAVWCLHSALVNKVPHNPSTYDLANDYTDFTPTSQFKGREVNTDYLLDSGL